MTDNLNQSIPVEAARTPVSAEGERDPAEQNDRADESIVGQADEDEDEDDEFDDDELDEDDEDEDEDESDESAQ